VVRGVKIPWIGVRYSMGRGVKIPWKGVRYTMERKSKYHGNKGKIPWTVGSI
jgi:hypothetical protein